MTTLNIILAAILLFVELVLIVVVLLQKSKTEGMTSILGGNDTESFFSKNRNSSREAKLALITKICMIVLVVIAIVLTVLFSIPVAE